MGRDNNCRAQSVQRLEQAEQLDRHVATSEIADDHQGKLALGRRTAHDRGARARLERKASGRAGVVAALADAAAVERSLYGLGDLGRGRRRCGIQRLGRLIHGHRGLDRVECRIWVKQGFQLGAAAKCKPTHKNHVFHASHAIGPGRPL